jgi:hypothetical protein
VPRSRSRADSYRWLLGLLPSAATAIAEGAWIAIVYGALQVVVSGRPGFMGVWTFVVVAAIGTIVVRVWPSGTPGIVAVAAVVVGTALAGWASDPAVRAIVADRQIGGLVTGGFGWLLGYAAWRGSRHRDALSDDVVVGSLLTWVVPGLAIPWWIGAGSSYRQAFVETALPETLLFVSAGLIAVGLTRLRALGELVGVDWRRNRAWLSMLFGVVIIVALIGVPIAWLLGISAEATGRTLVGPAVDGVAAIAAPIEHSLGGLLPAGTPIEPSSPPVGGTTTSLVSRIIDTVVVTGVAISLIGVLLVFRRIVTSEPRSGVEPESVVEMRQIVSPPLPGGLQGLRLPHIGLGRRRPPRTASEAYLVVLGRLDSDETLRRGPAESPSAHARRLRAVGRGALSFELLAADFELERYRGSRLTPREVDRAVRRSRIDPGSGRRTPTGVR